MMTRVYSRCSGDASSASSSCAAPRTPPSGFLISWARLRSSCRLASDRPSWRSSRSTLSCCSISEISSTSGVLEPYCAVAVTRTGTGSRPNRFSSSTCRRSPNVLVRASATSCCICSSSPITRSADWPSRFLRDIPSSSSAAWFTCTMRAAGSSTMTAVDSRSSPSNCASATGSWWTAAVMATTLRPRRAQAGRGGERAGTYCVRSSAISRRSAPTLVSTRAMSSRRRWIRSW